MVIVKINRGTKTSFNPNNRIMKTFQFLPIRALSIGAIIGSCVFAMPNLAEAKGPHGKEKSSKHGKHNSSSKHEKQQKSSGKKYAKSEHDRSYNRYKAHPRSAYALAPGDGYAGKGYYFGPPNSDYFHKNPYVRYFPTREAAMNEYFRSSDSQNAAIQRLLERQGYYNGSIDGVMGPQSRRAIQNYQRDRGITSDGIITSSLLRLLGL